MAGGSFNFVCTRAISAWHKLWDRRYLSLGPMIGQWVQPLVKNGKRLPVAATGQVNVRTHLW